VAAVEFERLTGQRPAFKSYLTKGESFEGLDLTREPRANRDVAL